MAQSNEQGGELRDKVAELIAKDLFYDEKLDEFMQLILADRKQHELDARLSEAKLLDRRVADKFEKLCREVESNPNRGNSSKGKKDNFLDGAESMMLVTSIRIAELRSQYATES